MCQVLMPHALQPTPITDCVRRIRAFDRIIGPPPPVQRLNEQVVALFTPMDLIRIEIRTPTARPMDSHTTIQSIHSFGELTLW